jgi:hypothetical protein
VHRPRAEDGGDLFEASLGFEWLTEEVYPTGSLGIQDL